MHVVTSRLPLWLLLLPLAMALAACRAAEPGGQVVAVVDGEEITFPELAEEARARGLVIGNDRAARNRLLDEVIDRKLLVQEAKRRELDRTPAHLLAKRRSDELLLSQALLSSTAGRVEDPSPQEVATFIRSHPWAFADRMLISVDRLSFPAPADPALRQALAAAPSLEAVAQTLARAGIKADRRSEMWDSAQLPPGWSAALVSGGHSRPRLLEGAGSMVAAQVLSLLPQPVPPAQREAAARQWLKTQRQNERLRELILKAREEAQIDRQEGFAPN